tara:strand:- start:448 stop:603 length:156 start_codon:yes stop_codon:yes gene_type:complete
MARPPSIRFRATDRAAIEITLPVSCYIHNGDLFINDIRRKTHGKKEKKRNK